MTSDPPSMSTMLNLNGVNVHAWGSQELREMLRHQLAAPLQLSLGTLSAEVAHQVKQAGVDPRMTLDQLLNHPRPPIELLKLVKRFAKMCRRDRENALPSEIAMLLYYASIAAALLRTEQPISDLKPASLQRGMSWLIGQEWLTDDMRSLLKDGLARVQSH